MSRRRERERERDTATKRRGEVGVGPRLCENAPRDVVSLYIRHAYTDTGGVTIRIRVGQISPALSVDEGDDDDELKCSPLVVPDMDAYPLGE